MPTYALSLESGPRKQKTMVHVTELLGCIATGPTTDDALKATPAAIQAYLRFLKRHGEDVKLASDFDTIIVEHIMQGMFLGNGSAEIVFRADLDKLSTTAVEKNLHHLAWLAEEVEQVVSTVKQPELDEQPSEKQRTVREIVQHMLQSETYYVWALLGKVEAASKAVKLAEKGENDLTKLLQQTHQAHIERIKVMTPAERTQPVSRGKETWTAHKMLRRVLEHKWEHLNELKTRLNVPDND
jgi:predicted RNase H-like HicB family nuclease